MYSYDSDDMDTDSGSAKKAANGGDDGWGDDGGDDGWGDDGDADMDGGDDGEGWGNEDQAATAVANASSDNSWKVNGRTTHADDTQRCKATVTYFHSCLFLFLSPCLLVGSSCCCWSVECLPPRSQ